MYPLIKGRAQQGMQEIRQQPIRPRILRSLISSSCWRISSFLTAVDKGAHLLEYSIIDTVNSTRTAASSLLYFAAAIVMPLNSIIE